MIDIHHLFPIHWLAEKVAARGREVAASRGVEFLMLAIKREPDDHETAAEAAAICGIQRGIGDDGPFVLGGADTAPDERPRRSARSVQVPPRPAAFDDALMQALVEFIWSRIGQASTWAGVIILVAPVAGVSIDDQTVRLLADAAVGLVGLSRSRGTADAHPTNATRQKVIKSAL